MEAITKQASLDELPEVARWILDNIDHRVILFKGSMGAGKTTLIKEVCRQLGVTDEVSSPTFSLVNEYKGDQGPVYHFDFYRLDKEEEAYDFGVEEYLDSENWCLLEWPEKISNLLPDEYTVLSITHCENSRKYQLN